MPAPLAKGIIITVSVLIAAGIAAYESPEVRKWVNNSRQKIAMALHSLGDEISPNVKANKKRDPSMDEEKTDEAEERRRKAREDIMEKARLLEERKRRKSQVNRDSGVGSFDTLVDENGKLLDKSGGEEAQGTAATTTAVEQPSTDGLTKRGNITSSSSSHHVESEQVQMDPLSNYENELRENWNLPLPPITTAASQTSHASESLLDLTPTSEFPDPDFSVPDPTTPSRSQSQHESQFFSIPNLPEIPTQAQQPTLDSPLIRSRTISPNPLAESSSTSSSYYYAHPSHPNQPLPDLPPSNNSLQVQQPRNQAHQDQRPTSSVLSVADSSDLEHIHNHDHDHDHDTDNDNDNDIQSIASLSTTDHSGHFSHNDFSSDVGHGNVDEDDDDEEYGDGIRTPEGSLWTDVGSSVSGGGD